MIITFLATLLYMVNILTTQNIGLHNKQEPLLYDAKALSQQQRALENLRSCHFNGDETILDLGCGNGAITAFIAKEKNPKGKVIGADLDPEMVDFAIKKHGSLLPNLIFECHNATKLPFNRYFDLVVSFACISWISKKEHKLVMQNVYDSLRIGGRMFIRLAGEGKRPLHEAIQIVCERELWVGHFVDYEAPWSFQNKEDFNLLLKEIGFQNISIQDASKTVFYKGVEKFSEWLKTWVPHRHRLPQALWDIFFDNVSKAYCEKLGLEFNADIPITMPALLVEANR